MATCKDCLHHDLCKCVGTIKMYPEKSDGCSFFKERSRFVELPCKVGDTVWYIRDCSDWVDACQQPCKVCSIDCSSYRTVYREDWEVYEFLVEDIKDVIDVFMNFNKDFFATCEEAEVEVAKRRANRGEEDNA